jgi:spore germination cell wall hydrolase CwlJ-like protein
VSDDLDILELEHRAHRRSWALPVVLGAVATLCLGFAAFAFAGLMDYHPAKAPEWKPVIRSEIVIDDETKALLLDTKLLPVSTEEAERINAERAPEAQQVAAAKPFVVQSALRTSPQFMSALDCLTQAVYYEAGFESEAGKRAVAQVVLNRVRHPAFPKSVCGVVYQGSERTTGCQFSFTCDGSLARIPASTAWGSARQVAQSALSGWVERSVGTATHYHANYVVPYWASSLNKVTTIGAHIFYTMRGSLGSSGAFNSRYDFAAETIPAPSLPSDAAAASASATESAFSAGDAAKPVPPRPALMEDEAVGTIKPAAISPDLPKAPQSGLRADEERGQLIVPSGGLN